MSIYQGNKKVLGGVSNIEEDKVKEIVDSKIVQTIDTNSTNDTVPSAKSVYDLVGSNNVLGKETILYDTAITATGTYTLTDNVNNYDFIVLNHVYHTDCKQSIVLTKNEISLCIDEPNRFLCVHGYGSELAHIGGYFNGDKVIITARETENISSIVGYKFGRVTVENTIANPAPEQSYSLEEQLTGGTWIDGKPIYRKTINCGVLPNNTTKNVPHGITNIGSVINIYGVATSGDKAMSLPYVATSSTYCVSVYRDESTIAIQTASDRTEYTKTYVTLEYTKTTD